MDKSKISVRKRNGETEPYDSKNVYKVVKAAGLNDEESRKISDQVNNWIISQGKSEISSLEIRDQVINYLKEINTDIADLYRWYESTKK